MANMWKRSRRRVAARGRKVTETQRVRGAKRLSKQTQQETEETLDETNSDEKSSGGRVPRESNLKLEAPRWMVPLLEKSRYKGAHGGRGSGKSHAFATMLIAAHVADPDRSTVCVREVQKSLKQSVKKLLETKIRSLEVGDYFDVKSTEIRSKKGTGIILFEGMADHTAESIKSLEGFDCAWVEEAQALSQKSLDLLRPTIRKPGSEIWFTWNPVQETDPVDAFLRPPKGVDAPPDSVVVKVNYTDNPWFPVTLRPEVDYDRRVSGEKYLHVWEGEYVKHAEARVFKRWRVEDFETPKNAVLRFGADWGSVDPTVLVRIFIEGRQIYIDYEAYQIGCEIDDTPSLFLTIPEAEKWQIVGGSDRPERIKHMQKHGFKVIGAVRGPNSYEQGIEWLENYEIVVHPRCVHAIDELRLFMHPIDPLTGRVLPGYVRENDHVIEALRYACEAVRRTAMGRNVMDFVVRPVLQRWGGARG